MAHNRSSQVSQVLMHQVLEALQPEGMDLEMNYPEVQYPDVDWSTLLPLFRSNPSAWKEENAAWKPTKPSQCRDRWVDNAAKMGGVLIKRFLSYATRERNDFYKMLPYDLDKAMDKG